MLATNRVDLELLGCCLFLGSPFTQVQLLTAYDFELPQSEVQSQETKKVVQTIIILILSLSNLFIYLSTQSPYS
jgi:hypothetical protein